MIFFLQNISGWFSLESPQQFWVELSGIWVIQGQIVYSNFERIFEITEFTTPLVLSIDVLLYLLKIDSSFLSYADLDLSCCICRQPPFLFDVVLFCMAQFDLIFYARNEKCNKMLHCTCISLSVPWVNNYVINSLGKIKEMSPIHVYIVGDCFLF